MADRGSFGDFRSHGGSGGFDRGPERRCEEPQQFENMQFLGNWNFGRDGFKSDRTQNWQWRCMDPTRQTNLNRNKNFDLRDNLNLGRFGPNRN